VTPSRIAVGSWNALKSNPSIWDSVRLDSVPMLTRKKNRAMKIGGTTASRSRGIARSARPAIDAVSVTNPAGRARIARGAPGIAVASAVIGWPPRLRWLL
jgi:hypothetical protein